MQKKDSLGEEVVHLGRGGDRGGQENNVLMISSMSPPTRPLYHSDPFGEGCRHKLKNNFHQELWLMAAQAVILHDLGILEWQSLDPQGCTERDRELL